MDPLDLKKRGGERAKREGRKKGRSVRAKSHLLIDENPLSPREFERKNRGGKGARWRVTGYQRSGGESAGIEAFN